MRVKHLVEKIDKVQDLRHILRVIKYLEPTKIQIYYNFSRFYSQGVQQISQGSPTYLVGLVVVRDEFVKADDLAVEDCHAVKGLGHHA